ncbi:effector-associated domain EAD1-containing protein [Frankia sp. AgW1.1]|uniref:effector-associated domain EAD1-containing protein n=1 Tax=Frankia sp. AgW1.1 TaxID=1836971 RepID=UPI00193303A9|nr:effector-associated domain EAD1-containing protein [Frankia sp. AgW1.1]MBL7487153.1 hypothetical protein [Frankia sp. AgW1.1]
MTDRFTAAELGELSRVYWNIPSRTQLLNRAGIAYRDQPHFENVHTASEWWQAVDEALKPGQRPAILTEAAADYPVNPFFAAGRVPTITTPEPTPVGEPYRVTSRWQTPPPMPRSVPTAADDKIGDGEIRDLADRFCREEQAREVLIRAGVPSRRISWLNDPYLFWWEMARLLNGGMLVGGVAALRRAVAEAPDGTQ